MSIGSLLGSRELRLLVIVASAAAAGSCGGGGDSTGPPDDPGPPAVASVEVTPTELNLSVGQASQLTATVRAADGSALTDRPVTWATGDGAIATVDATGLVTAVTTGDVAITATSEGKSSSAAVTVSTITVATVEVVPNPSSVAIGQTAQLTAVAKATDGTELINRPVTWVTGDAAIATVDDKGLVTGVAVGEVTITATSEGKSGTSLLTVSAVQVASVEVDPATATIAEGATVQLTATARDGGGTPLVGRPATWTTSDANVARVNATGRVTGIGAGSATITATIEGKTGSASVTVTASAVASVEVTPPTATVVVGRTAQLTATVKAGDGTVLPGRPVTWSSSAEGVATVSATGLVRSVAPGTATITATSEGKQGTATVTVTAVAGITRTWKGGASGKATDWSTAENWTPAGKPIPLDTVRVPQVANPAVLTEDVQIARLIVVGGKVRTAGHRLAVKGNLLH